MMSAPRWGPVIDSIWSPTTFNAEVLRNIAGKALPDEPFLGEAEHLAQAMNSAACELLLSLRGHKKAADAETWALGIAEACAALVSVCGHPWTRAALRLGLPH